MLRLFDTAAGALRPLVPLRAGAISMYVCGPTVDDVPHLGHGRFVLVFDILRRYLEWGGAEVLHVSNVTDVDDKIIARAAREAISTTEVAARNEAAWWAATDALGVARPTHAPRATDYIPQMLDLIARLVGAGHAYAAADGVYLQVDTVPGYGLLARQPLDSLRAGARVAPGESKRSPLDFVLWKLAKPGEPRWPSPWGPGRPGWHTECVAMALDLLGPEFDLHGGGADLAFPHHENERAQAAALGLGFARHWCHNGWVLDSAGTKMSKSLGNSATLTDLLARTDPRAYRLTVARSHYRAPLLVTPDTIADSERALARLDTLARRAILQSGEIMPSPPDRSALAGFAAAMDDDLDTPAATAVVFESARSANAAFDSGDAAEGSRQAATVAELAAVLGLALSGVEPEPTPAEAELVARRAEARSAQDWAGADALRAELAQRGWVVEDTPAGPKLRRAP